MQLFHSFISLTRPFVTLDSQINAEEIEDYQISSLVFFIGLYGY